MRPTFHSRYIVSAAERRSKDQRPGRNGPRLLDCIKIVQTDLDFVSALQTGEFAVVDLERREKAVCELPSGGLVQAAAMIESYFAKAPIRITDRIWAV